MSRSTGASQESESYSSMSPAQVVVAGTALLRPLLAVYRASLSEEDRVRVLHRGPEWAEEALHHRTVGQLNIEG